MNLVGALKNCNVKDPGANGSFRLSMDGCFSDAIPARKQ